MEEFQAAAGEGRTRVSLWASSLGDDLIVHIYNENAHVGAVAVAEYDQQNQRTSVSVLTRLGHKDDAISQKVAHTISKATKRAVCVIAGFHIEDITAEEISQVLVNAGAVVERFLEARKKT